MIQFIDVKKRFGEREILDGVNLNIVPNKTTVVLGISGGGKSTIIKHIVGLLKADSGKIIVDGVDISDNNEEILLQTRKKVGFLFQSGALFDSMNVYENVAFPLREHTQKKDFEIEEIVDKNLKMVGLDPSQVKNLFPDELSGGMRKRASLARCLVSDPDIMLFDEPTTGLDPLTSNTINELILSTFDRLRFTGIVVSHEIPGIFSLVHKVAMLYEGSIIAYGTPEEIMEVDNPTVKRFIEAGIAQGQRKRGVREL